MQHRPSIVITVCVSASASGRVSIIDVQGYGYVVGVIRSRGYGYVVVWQGQHYLGLVLG